MFAHLGIVSLWNETFQTMQTMRGLSLFRNSFSNEVISPTQPEPVYYMLRTLSTALEDVKGAEIPVSFTERRKEPPPVTASPRQVEFYGFSRGAVEKLAVFWDPGYADENGKNPANFSAVGTLKGPKGQGATIIDVLNGTEKPLKIESTSDGAIMRKIQVQSWPLIIRLPS
ncbi:MAG: hypothetical protein EXQ58_03340 [Acidobacteria bacterium]|nr:hypothetical protein [Acidobacteriota bacterium]